MHDSVLVSPSILSADMAHLADDLDKIAGADYIHIDVMDVSSLSGSFFLFFFVL